MISNIIGVVIVLAISLWICCRIGVQVIKAFRNVFGRGQ